MQVLYNDDPKFKAILLEFPGAPHTLDQWLDIREWVVHNVRNVGSSGRVERCSYHVVCVF